MIGNKFNFANEHCIKWGYFSYVFLLLLCVHRVVSWFIKSQNDFIVVSEFYDKVID
jgi:hypothetical protein